MTVFKIVIDFISLDSKLINDWIPLKIIKNTLPTPALVPPPGGPGGPIGPAGPDGPVGPLGPGGPAGPLAPVTPLDPVAPVRP